MDPALAHDLVLAAPATVAALISIVNMLLHRSLRIEINGRIDALLKASTIAAEAKGRAAGVESERTRQNDRRVAP